MNSKKKFTLIELLVVIAIIAILASMLLPALKNAKQTGKDIACLNNQKQYFLMFQFYTSDSNGFFPLWREPSQEVYNSTRFMQMGYTDSPYVMQCTSFPESADSLNFSDLSTVAGTTISTPLTQGWKFNRIHYGYNYKNIGSSYRASGNNITNLMTNIVPAKNVQIRNPTETILFADSASYGSIISNTARGVSFINDNLTNGNPIAHARHGGRSVNVGWVDGHGTKEGRGKSPLDAYTGVLGNYTDNPAVNFWDRK